MEIQNILKLSVPQCPNVHFFILYKKFFFINLIASFQFELLKTSAVQLCPIYSQLEHKTGLTYL